MSEQQVLERAAIEQGQLVVPLYLGLSEISLSLMSSSIEQETSTQTNGQDTASLKGQEYRIYRPCAFFLTDGEPNDSDWRTVSAVTYERLKGQGAGPPLPESHGVNVDQSFNDLLEASSLGTPAARRIRSSTPSEVVDDVRLRMEHRRERSPSHTAAARDRLAALHARAEDAAAAMRAQVEDETALGARHRINYGLGTALALAVALLDALPVYVSAQAFGLGQTSTIIITVLLCAALGGAIWLLDLFHRQGRRPALWILEGTLGAGFVTIFALRLDYLQVTIGDGFWSAALEAAALTAISAALVAAGFVVLSHRTPAALARAERLYRQAAQRRAAEAAAAAATPEGQGSNVGYIREKTPASRQLTRTTPGPPGACAHDLDPRG